MGTLRIALAQINPTVGDLPANVAAIGRSIDAARAAGSDIVVLPELAVCGYPPEDLLLKPSFLRDCQRALDDVARHTQGIIALVGFPHALDGQVFNAAALLQDTQQLSVYHKVELPNYGVFDEKRYFEPGSKSLVFELNGLRVFATICEDVWVEGGAVEGHAKKNRADVVINISGSPFHAGKLADRQGVLAGFAQRTGAFLCYANLVGGQDELVFDGGSLVLGPSGELLASATRFEEALLIADLRRDLLKANHAPRQANGRWGRRLLLSSDNYKHTPPPPATVAPTLDHLAEVHQALVMGTGDYVRKNGFDTVVVGLSGGIDSSLTAAIAVEALGPDHVVGVTMPSQYTSNETLTDAEQLAANLSIRLITVPIKPVFASYLDALDEAFGQGEAGIECENLQARIRGNILMALSNRFGWLVLTTGNKSEVAVGYCTLYGDMAGGFAVIKDVPKTLVYTLSQRVNQQAGRQLIPDDVLTRAPSAELKPDQKDADSLPPYPVLDPIVRAYVEQDKAIDEIDITGCTPAIVGEIVRLVDRSEYKRRQSPPGVKITPKAFGRDRRMPITCRYTNGSPKP